MMNLPIAYDVDAAAGPIVPGRRSRYPGFGAVVSAWRAIGRLRMHAPSSAEARLREFQRRQAQVSQPLQTRPGMLLDETA
jgi:hypothetical protein